MIFQLAFNLKIVFLARLEGCVVKIKPFALAQQDIVVRNLS